MSHLQTGSPHTSAAPETRRRPIIRQAAMVMMLGAALGATGCMTTPEDGEHIGNWNNAVDFSGVSGYPDEWIAIQAWNSDMMDWETIGYALTDDAAMAGSDGELFEFSVSLVVPEDNWIPWGFNTAKSNVRAVVYDTGEICSASSGEPFATIWANYPPPTIVKDVEDLQTR